MASKTKHVGTFLLTGIVLAIAAIYVFPMQAAMACGCDGGHKKGGGSGGSLVNVQDNNIGNVKNKDIKFLNNDKVLSNNKIKDVNVLSKNGGNKFLSDTNILNGENKFLSDNDNSRILSNLVKHNDVGNSILTDYYKKLCTC